MLTVDEAAKFLKVHPQTIYRWIYKGKLRSLKICGTVRIKEEDLNSLIVTR